MPAPWPSCAATFAAALALAAAAGPDPSGLGEEDSALLQFSREAPQAEGEAPGSFSRSEALEFFKGKIEYDGCRDAEFVMHLLRRSWERNSWKGIFVDVGANVGQTTARMLEIFGGLDHPRFRHTSDSTYSIDDAMVCDKVHPTPQLHVHAFEPTPGTFKVLERRAQDHHWDSSLKGNHHITLHNQAVSDASGRMTFFHGMPGDEGGSLLEKSANTEGMQAAGKGNDRDEVEVVALDDVFLKNLREEKKPIHLLSIDAEGFDGKVLRGAHGLLEDKLVKFLVFEYNWKWENVPGMSLRRSTEELHGLGYSCFLLAANTLIPLSGDWWQDDYEFWQWANVLCGQRGDRDLFDAYVGYGTNELTLEFALRELRPRGPAAT